MRKFTEAKLPVDKLKEESFQQQPKAIKAIILLILSWFYCLFAHIDNLIFQMSAQTCDTGFGRSERPVKVENEGHFVGLLFLIWASTAERGWSRAQAPGFVEVRQAIMRKLASLSCFDPKWFVFRWWMKWTSPRGQSWEQEKEHSRSETWNNDRSLDLILCHQWGVIWSVDTTCY